MPIEQITSVEFKNAGRMVTGYIQLVFGRQEDRTELRGRSRGENAVGFNYQQREPFVALKEAIEQRIAESPGLAETSEEMPKEPTTQALENPEEATVATAPVSKGAGGVGEDERDREFEVEGQPEVCIGLARDFFDSEEWPYPITRGLIQLIPRLSTRLSGPVKPIAGSNKGKMVVTALVHRPALIESLPGILFMVLVTLITAGVFTGAYFFYYWFLRAGSGIWAGSGRRVTIVAEPAGHDKTRVQVKGAALWPSQKRHMLEPVLAWIERELVDNRAAAGAEAPHEVADPAARLEGLKKSVEGAVSKVTDGAHSPNPADQIRKLAELRDTGALTDEEFEAKKRDLLDRM